MKLISRKEAIHQGLTRYFTGILCKHGHISERYTSNWKCCICHNIDSRKYSSTHLVEINENNKTWQSLNKDKVVEYRKTSYNKNKVLIAKKYQSWYNKNKKRVSEYRHKNRIKFNKTSKLWRDNNPHKVKVQNHLRNTRLEQSIPIWYEEDLVKQVYLKRDELNKLWGTRFEVDHIIPLNPRYKTVSGLHCWANLQLLDISLNCSKGSTYNTDW